jgi:hypothetical protein
MVTLIPNELLSVGCAAQRLTENFNSVRHHSPRKFVPASDSAARNLEQI